MDKKNKYRILTSEEVTPGMDITGLQGYRRGTWFKIRYPIYRVQADPEEPTKMQINGFYVEKVRKIIEHEE